MIHVYSITLHFFRISLVFICAAKSDILAMLPLDFTLGEIRVKNKDFGLLRLVGNSTDQTWILIMHKKMLLRNCFEM